MPAFVRKILVKRSRQRHYRKIRDKSLILPSETVSEASDKDSIFSGDEHDFSASNDVEMTEQIVAKAVSERAMSIDSSNYASSNITGSPLASQQGDYADNHTDFKFDSDDMDEDQSEQNSADGAEELLDLRMLNIMRRKRWRASLQLKSCSSDSRMRWVENLNDNL